MSEVNKEVEVVKEAEGSNAGRFDGLMILDNSVRRSAYNKPTLEVTCTNNTFKAYEKLAELLDIKAGENIILITNGTIWCIAKAWKNKDDEFVGAKTNRPHKSITVLSGQTVQFNQSSAYQGLGGQSENKKIYTIDPTPIYADVDGSGTERLVYFVDGESVVTKDKIIKTPAGSKTNGDTNEDDRDAGDTDKVTVDTETTKDEIVEVEFEETAEEDIVID